MSTASTKLPMDHCQIPETHDNGAIVLTEIPHDFGTHRYIVGNHHQVILCAAPLEFEKYRSCNAIVFIQKSAVSVAQSPL